MPNWKAGVSKLIIAQQREEIGLVLVAVDAFVQGEVVRWNKIVLENKITMN